MRNAFIVTQGPMENTIEDFWEMIWEYKSHAIVMLTPLKENEKVRITQPTMEYYISSAYDSFIPLKF